MSGSFTDPQSSFTHLVIVHWGDGNSTTDQLPAGQTDFSEGPHSYASAGSYNVSFSVAGLDGATTSTYTAVTVNDYPDEVMIGSLVPSASEFRTQQGEYMITRVGPATGSLTVGFSVSGGTVGTDYTIVDGGGATLTTNSITIPAGQTSVPVFIKPIEQYLTFGECAVSLTLSSGTGYSVSDAYPGALVTIYYDYPTSPPEDYLSGGITCFNVDGTDAHSAASAVTGDFIVIGIAGNNGVAPYNPTAYLDYDESKVVVCTSPDGSDVIHSHTPMMLLTQSYKDYYVRALNSSSPVEVDDCLRFYALDAWHCGFDLSVDVGFEPLQLMFGDVDVTNKHTSADDVSFLLGDKPTLSVANAPAGATFQWTLPGDPHAVADFDPKKLNNQQVTPLTDKTSLSLTFVWTDDGNDREIDVAVTTTPLGKPQTLKAWFNVLPPSADLPAAQATFNTTTLQNGSDGVNIELKTDPFNNRLIAILGNLPTTPGVSFDANPESWNVAYEAGWLQTGSLTVTTTPIGQAPQISN